MKHLMSNAWIERRGPKAFCRSNALLLIRDQHDGVWFDIESHLRFFDRVECIEGRWRLVQRTGVYDKDRLDTLDGTILARTTAEYPDAARELCWWLATRGMTPVPGLTEANSDEEEQLRLASMDWLEALGRTA